MKKLLFLFSLYFLSCVPPDKPDTTEPSVDTTDVGFNPDSLYFPTEAGSMVFYSPKDSALADKRFPKLKYLNLLPALAVSKITNAKVLHVEDYTSWEAAGINNTAIEQFHLTPGDYTKWGPLNPTRSGTKGKPLIIRYIDQHAAKPFYPAHPVRLKEQHREAIIEGFKLQGVDNVILHGLTVRGVTGGKGGVAGGMKNSIVDCNNVVVDYCLFENCTALGIRVVNSADVWIQCCVARQLDKRLNGDGGFCGVSATKGRPSKCFIVGNEIKNFNDCLGFPREGDPTNTGPEGMTGEVYGVIEGNDLYVDSSLYVIRDGVTYACSENAIDCKNGNKSGAAILITGNRMFGFRQSDPSCGPSGSAGPAVTLHRNASNIAIQNNFIWDCPVAISVLASDNKFTGESMSGLVVKNNLVFDLTPGGTGFQLANSVTVANNTVVGAKYGFLLANAKAKPVVGKNLFINCGVNDEGKWPGNVWRTGVPQREVAVYFKRWSGVEKRIINIF